ncbi:hypothetical protein [Erwinia amylovora]
MSTVVAIPVSYTHLCCIVCLFLVLPAAVENDDPTGAGSAVAL